LIRDQFDITDLEQIRNKSKGLTVGSLEGILGTVLLKAGLRSVDHTYKWIRKEVPRAHGFRKFFTTQLINSDVNPEIREMLLGHKIGLTGCYYRPTEHKMYNEYLKAVDLLTINEENRLKRELEQKIQIEKSQIESLKADFEKFKQEVLKQREDNNTYFLFFDSSKNVWTFHTSRTYKISKIRAITGGICCKCNNYNTHLLKYRTQGVTVVERYCTDHVPTP